MIDDVREACMNMQYPGMNFDPEEIVDTISDPSFKAWQAMLKGVEFADKNDLKEVNTRRNANIVMSDRLNKDATQTAQAAIDKLQGARKNDYKQMLKRLVKYNTEAHESAAKASQELMGLLEYLPLSAWLKVADAATRPLVNVQIPEVMEIVSESQVLIDRKKPRIGESPIEDIVTEQNLPDMMQLRHVWGYGRDDVGKKMLATIVYKYLKEQMFPKAHVTTAFFSVKFAMTSSTLHKYIVGMKYKGGAPPGSKYKPSKSEEWTRKQININKGAGSSGTMTEESSKGKGAGKKSGKKRDAMEICEATSKPKKKRKAIIEEDDEEEEDHNQPLKPPVTHRGIIIPN